MAFVLTCPHCTAKLKTKQRIACGDPSICPNCNREFAAADIVEDAPGPIVPREAPPETTRTEGKSQRLRRIEPQDDPPRDDPGSGRHDDEERQSLWNRDRDDDRSSRNRAYDDGGSRPRPSARMARRRRRRAKGRNVLFFVISFAGTLALLGIVLLIANLFSSSGSDEEMIACLPADSTLILGLEIESLSKVKKGIGSLNRVELDEFGLSKSDIEKLITGITDKDDSMMVIRLKGSFNKDRFVDYNRAEARKEKGKVYYELRRQQQPTYACLPSDSLLVIAPREDTIRDMLRRDRSKPAIAKSLQELAKSVSSASVWAVSIQNGNDRLGFMGGALGNRFTGDDVRGLGFSMNIKDEQIDIKLAILTHSSETANRVCDQIQSEIKRDKVGLFGEGANSATVGSDGPMVTVSCRAKKPSTNRDDNRRGDDFFRLFQ